MTLVLEPENLGTVTVKMQMRGDSLDLQLDVANPQTLALLNKDRDSLTAAMNSQDYAMGTLTMRASEAQTSSPGSNDGSQNQGSSGQGSNPSASDGGQNGGAYQNGGTFSDGSSGGRGTGGNAASSASQSSQLDADPSNSSPSSGIYI
jgi:flagellar hook-length control protein FliK